MNQDDLTGNLTALKRIDDSLYTPLLENIGAIRELGRLISRETYDGDISLSAMEVGSLGIAVERMARSMGSTIDDIRDISMQAAEFLETLKEGEP